MSNVQLYAITRARRHVCTWPLPSGDFPVHNQRRSASYPTRTTDQPRFPCRSDRRCGGWSTPHSGRHGAGYSGDHCARLDLPIARLAGVVIDVHLVLAEGKPDLSTPALDIVESWQNQTRTQCNRLTERQCQYRPRCARTHPADFNYQRCRVATGIRGVSSQPRRIAAQALRRGHAPSNSPKRMIDDDAPPDSAHSPSALRSMNGSNGSDAASEETRLFRFIQTQYLPTALMNQPLKS